MGMPNSTTRADFRHEGIHTDSQILPLTNKYLHVVFFFLTCNHSDMELQFIGREKDIQRQTYLQTTSVQVFDTVEYVLGIKWEGIVGNCMIRRVVCQDNYLLLQSLYLDRFLSFFYIYFYFPISFSKLFGTLKENTHTLQLKE